MAEVEDAAALLVMALRDAHDGKLALEQRLGTVRGNARDADLRRLIEADWNRAVAARATLAGLVRSLGDEEQGEPNVWLRAILDDADNDARTIAAGALRDIALVGVLRKAKQAERVSHETAIALASRLGLTDAARTLTCLRDEEQTADDTLAQALARLTAQEQI